MCARMWKCECAHACVMVCDESMCVWVYVCVDGMCIDMCVWWMGVCVVGGWVCVCVCMGDG